MKVIEKPIGDIRMRFRLRTPKESKIAEIASSIEQLGLLNPITITSDNYLIAGFHRLHACKLLKYETIPAVVKDTSKVYGELMEIDENLKRNELNHIEIAEHMVRRGGVARRTWYKDEERRESIYGGNMVTTNELAEEIGLSNRVYRLKRQPATINEEALRSIARYQMGRKLDGYGETESTRGRTTTQDCSRTMLRKICNL